MKWDDPELTKYDPSWKQEGQWWSGLDNYWAGAKKACDDIGMSLPDDSKLRSIYKAGKKDSSLGLPTFAWFWGSSEYGTSQADRVSFNDGLPSYGYKYDSYHKVLCVGD